MSLFSGLAESFDFWILVNILAILFSVFISAKAFLAMRIDQKAERLQRLRINARRKHEYSQRDPQQFQPLTMVFPGEEESVQQPREKFLRGNDLLVVSKNLLRKTAAQKVSENIGET